MITTNLQYIIKEVKKNKILLSYKYFILITRAVLVLNLLDRNRSS